MPSVTISRSQTIAANSKKIFKLISDLSKYKKIEPWELIQPNASIQLSSSTTEIGSSYEWNGKIVGNGKITILDTEDSQKVKLNLDFFKPEKYLGNTIEWNLEEHESKKPSCTVTRSMTIPFPWLMFPFAKIIQKKMDASIGLDHELCLKRLAHLAHPQSEPAIDTVLKKSEIFDSFNYIGLNFKKIPAEQINKLTQETHLNLKEFLKQDKITSPYSFISYRDINPETKKIDLLIGLAIKEKDVEKIKLYGEMVLGITPSQFCAKFSHSGTPETLPYAKRIAMMHTAKMQNYTHNKDKMILEIYKPNTTEIYIPIDLGKEEMLLN